MVVMASVPEGFEAVRDVRLIGSEIEITGSEGFEPIRLPFTPDWFPVE